MEKEKQIKHIAKLARFGLSQEEVVQYEKEFFSILEYVEKLKKLDLSHLQPTDHPFKIENVMRQDKEEKNPKENKKLLDQAPQLKDNYLKVNLIKESWS